jgi:hypothetical protein
MTVKTGVLIDRLIADKEPQEVIDQALKVQALLLMERATEALEAIAGVITQPDASEETGAPDPLSTMDG